MNVLILLYVFFFGICFGSFLNVVIDRIPHGMSILKGRSRCDACKHPLPLFDLIPVISFIFLHGECRYCHSKLSYQYPLVELATGLLWILTFLSAGSLLSSYTMVKIILLLFLFSLFFALSMMDIKYGILSDKVVATSIVLISVLLLLFSPNLFLSHVLVGIICFILFFLLFIATKGRGIGFGDVKLAFVMGLFLGFPLVILAFYIAFLTGGVVAIILVLAKKKKLVGGTIAFGPFLLLGTYISWYFGSSIWNIFLHQLGIN